MNVNLSRYDFSADRPIESREQDLLGRRGFAESIAAAIHGWHGNDSLVVSLYGTWGSGKSSIKNMVIDTLKESKESCPEIVVFNPWLWSGQNRIIEAFYQAIGIAIGRIDKKKHSDHIRNL